uniref:Uncharacterized protein n=1 Tax=Anguilla anguilla TaxID=7936 RepID=A0A0E9T3B3_ANGAN
MEATRLDDVNDVSLATTEVGEGQLCDEEVADEVEVEQIPELLSCGLIDGLMGRCHPAL